MSFTAGLTMRALPINASNVSFWSRPVAFAISPTIDCTAKARGIFDTERNQPILVCGEKIVDITLDRVFIGSCTNARIEDLREVARVVNGKTVNPNVYAMIVPGSGLVKEQAEAEGLDEIFVKAGFDWREPGCSMCLGMNPDKLRPGERCASTSNPQFRGSSGP